MADNIDQRGLLGANFPVWRLAKTVTIADESTAKSETVDINGRIEHLYVLTGAYDGSDTMTLTLVDENSVTLFTSAALAESTAHVLDVSILVAGTITITCTASAQQNDAAVANTITFYGV